ncbi:hypothetical protein NY2A_b640L [Paramecium bursaria Chlorella virus NY2A]|uniref:Uncharacterized protein b640L n=1 Tax=Paramecium bursaria Chlorella virus NY2A TaxID=46021 RepID=A7IXG5_PBCVN|nr:hypothetical protein NY2A_b640L [Paramecium bursaria Chlorella virus NY2A]ABT15039.1 hypothetical protein NY2A_b640L [Paramecium bursaria Chlorella virus NY2A]
MNGFVECLICIELSCLWCHHFDTKVCLKIFHHDTVGACKEPQNMFDEVSFIVVQFLTPVCNVCVKRNFLGGPKGCHCLLVHVPQIMILNGKRRELTRSVVGQNRFLCCHSIYFIYNSTYKYTRLSICRYVNRIEWSRVC